MLWPAASGRGCSEKLEIGWVGGGAEEGAAGEGEGVGRELDVAMTPPLQVT